MKKTIAAILISSALLSCNASKKQSNAIDASGHSSATSHQNTLTENSIIQKITFSTAMRGYSKNIILTPDSINTVTRNMSGTVPSVHQKLNVQEWSQLVMSLQQLVLAEIPKLESPTKGRETDAAKGSVITVFTGDKKQYAHYFDDNHPNEKLKPLMNAIEEIEKSKISN